MAVRPSAMPQVTTGVSTNGPPTREVSREVTNVAASAIDTTGAPRRYDSHDTPAIAAIAAKKPINSGQLRTSTNGTTTISESTAVNAMTAVRVRTRLASRSASRKLATSAGG